LITRIIHKFYHEGSKARKKQDVTDHDIIEFYFSSFFNPRKDMTNLN